MISNQLDMLKRLNPPIRSLAKRNHAPRKPFEGHGFDELLMLVAGEEIQSELPVTSILSEEELSEEQLERMSRAADTAQAAGFGMAIVLIDERAFVLNVSDRNIEEELGTESMAKTVKLDGAVYVPESDLDAEKVILPANLQSVIPEYIHKQIEAARNSAVQDNIQ